jgi:hypothetical protein
MTSEKAKLPSGGLPYEGIRDRNIALTIKKNQGVTLHRDIAISPKTRIKHLIKNDTLCSIGELALTLGITVRRIRQLQALEIVPKAIARGKYNLIECSKSYTAYQRQRIRQLQATGKKQRKFKKLAPAEMKSWMDTVNAQLQEFAQLVARTRKRNINLQDIKLNFSESNDIPGLNNIKLDLSQFEKKKR